MSGSTTKSTEYVVNEFDELGDIIAQDYYDTLAAALAGFELAAAPAELEKWSNTWRKLDGSLEDRQYQTVRRKE